MAVFRLWVLFPGGVIVWVVLSFLLFSFFVLDTNVSRTLSSERGSRKSNY